MKARPLRSGGRKSLSSSWNRIVTWPPMCSVRGSPGGASLDPVAGKCTIDWSLREEGPAVVRSVPRARWRVGLFLIGPLAFAAGDSRLDVARFAKDGLEGWEPKVFEGETHYRISGEDGRQVLRADS